jgi:hypothetical protein
VRDHTLMCVWCAGAPSSWKQRSRRRGTWSGYGSSARSGARCCAAACCHAGVCEQSESQRAAPHGLTAEQRSLEGACVQQRRGTQPFLGCLVPLPPGNDLCSRGRRTSPSRLSLRNAGSSRGRSALLRRALTDLRRHPMARLPPAPDSAQMPPLSQAYMLRADVNCPVNAAG